MNGSMGRQMLAAGACAAAVILATGLSSRAAQAWSDEIVNACTGDYLTYCKQHNPEGPEVRYCMEAHRNQLSKQCIKALVDAGEVPKKYLANVPQSNPKK
jgi:hypothetical protein